MSKDKRAQLMLEFGLAIMLIAALYLASAKFLISAADKFLRLRLTAYESIAGNMN